MVLGDRYRLQRRGMPYCDVGCASYEQCPRNVSVPDREGGELECKESQMC